MSTLLNAGTNVLGAVLSDGWFRGQNGAFRQFNQFGERLALLAQLELSAVDESRRLVVTGPEWTAATGAIVAAGLDAGNER
jgi:alpha-L-rhamnosidase